MLYGLDFCVVGPLGVCVCNSVGCFPFFRLLLYAYCIAVGRVWVNGCCLVRFLLICFGCLVVDCLVDIALFCLSCGVYYLLLLVLLVMLVCCLVFDFDLLILLLNFYIVGLLNYINMYYLLVCDRLLNVFVGVLLVV